METKIISKEVLPSRSDCLYLACVKHFTNTSIVITVLHEFDVRACRSSRRSLTLIATVFSILQEIIDNTYYRKLILSWRLQLIRSTPEHAIQAFCVDRSIRMRSWENHFTYKSHGSERRVLLLIDPYRIIKSFGTSNSRRGVTPKRASILFLVWSLQSS